VPGCALFDPFFPSQIAAGANLQVTTVTGG